MTNQQERPIVVGDRFETKDGRDKGRVVEVIAELGLSDSAAEHLAKRLYPDAHIRRVEERKTFFHVRTEARACGAPVLGCTPGAVAGQLHRAVLLEVQDRAVHSGGRLDV